MSGLLVFCIRQIVRYQARVEELERRVAELTAERGDVCAGIEYCEELARDLVRDIDDARRCGKAESEVGK